MMRSDDPVEAQAHEGPVERVSSRDDRPLGRGSFLEFWRRSPFHASDVMFNRIPGHFDDLDFILFDEDEEEG